MRLRLVTFALLVAAAFAACSGKSEQSGGASPAPTAQPTAAAATPSSAAPTSAATTSAAPLASGQTAPPTPVPTGTIDPDLLSKQNGTIVRAYTPAMDTAPRDVPDSGMRFESDAKGPYFVTFELAGVAQLTKLTADLIAAEQGRSATVTVSASTKGANDGFTDIATFKTGEAEATQNVNVTSPARWLRVTVDNGTANPLNGIHAYGTIAARPAGAPAPDGVYVERDDPYNAKDGAFDPTPVPSSDPWYARFVSVPAKNGPTGLTAMRCIDREYGEASPGTFDGRVWNFLDGLQPQRYILNDEGTQFAGPERVYVRTNTDLKYCKMMDGGGTGPNNVLVLDAQGPQSRYPMDEGTDALKGLHFDRLGAGFVDIPTLARYHTAMFNAICSEPKYLSAAQGAMLNDWVAGGGKLLIYDADVCGSSPTDYSYLPYPFKSDNPGAQGAKGDRLIEVENDQLGTLDAADKAHFFDPAPYALNGNQIGDADTVTSQDAHWCGHLFGTNANKVNGFMQMYAPYGKGLFIYDGFDHDDDGNTYYQRIVSLEHAASAEGNLPCTQAVAGSYVIEPTREDTFVPGKAIVKHFTMELLANQGWKGHVALKTTGDFPGSVSPSAIDLAGGTAPIAIDVRIPKSAKPGTYAVIVSGDDGSGKLVQSTIQLIANVPLVKQIKTQKRIRLYGIHFDVDSAHIQPRSEPVIAEVAKIMRDNPDWHFRIEGHTDSDGGMAHNVALSQHRAQAVVDDLVKRYHIARSRMIAKGFSYTRPVASNATAAGKALNRRVELVRL